MSLRLAFHQSLLKEVWLWPGWGLPQGQMARNAFERIFHTFISVRFSFFTFIHSQTRTTGLLVWSCSDITENQKQYTAVCEETPWPFQTDLQPLFFKYLPLKPQKAANKSCYGQLHSNWSARTAWSVAMETTLFFSAAEKKLSWKKTEISRCVHVNLVCL